MVVALVILGCLLTYFYSRRIFRRATAEAHRKTQAEVKVLQRAVEALEARIEELSKRAAVPVTVPLSAEAGALPDAQQGKVTPFPSKEGVSPEVVVMIAAAVTTFLGKKVRIHSAKRLQSPYEIVNPWAQQGRVIVQASHNLLAGPRSESFAARDAVL